MVHSSAPVVRICSGVMNLVVSHVSDNNEEGEEGFSTSPCAGVRVSHREETRKEELATHTVFLTSTKSPWVGKRRSARQHRCSQETDTRVTPSGNSRGARPSTFFSRVACECAACNACEVADLAACVVDVTNENADDEEDEEEMDEADEAEEDEDEDEDDEEDDDTDEASSSSVSLSSALSSLRMSLFSFCVSSSSQLLPSEEEEDEDDDMIFATRVLFVSQDSS